MSQNKTPAAHYAALLIGVICLGFSAIFVKSANAPGVISSFYRMGIALIVFTIPFLQRRLGQASPLPRRGVGLALLAGLFFGADMALWSEGIMISGATNPTLMANTSPVWVGLGALLIFREKLNRRFWAGLLIAIAGAALILGEDSLKGFSLGLGTAFGLIAGIFYGSYFLVAQRGRKHMDTLSFFYFSVVGSTAFLFLAALLRGVSFTNYPLESYLYFLAAGLITQVVGWFAVNFAQGYLPATIVSPTLLGQPVFTALLAVLLLNEGFSVWQAIGGTAIIAGILLVHRSRARRLRAPG